MLFYFLMFSVFVFLLRSISFVHLDNKNEHVEFASCSCFFKFYHMSTEKFDKLLEIIEFLRSLPTSEPQYLLNKGSF